METNYRQQLMQALYDEYANNAASEGPEVKQLDAALTERLQEVYPEGMKACGLYEDYITPYGSAYERQGFFAGLRYAFMLLCGGEKSLAHAE